MPCSAFLPSGPSLEEILANIESDPQIGPVLGFLSTAPVGRHSLSPSKHANGHVDGDGGSDQGQEQLQPRQHEGVVGGGQEQQVAPQQQ